MPFLPVTAERFGGLDLLHDPIEVGLAGAVDLLNVDLDQIGRVRTRPGRAYYSSADSATWSDEPTRIVAQQIAAVVYAASTTKFASYAAGSVFTSTITTGLRYSHDLLIDSSSTCLVIDGASMRQWDNGTHTMGGALAGRPYGGLMAFWAHTARIVTAGANLTGGSPDRVWFSDAGASTFGANNWVDLTPGGKERITGIVEHNEMIYVFKETQAFLFYGVSTDSGGNPIFNFRAINLGDRLPTTTDAGGFTQPPGRFSSDGEFIYYVASNGVYRLTGGGPPQLLSQVITPIFRGENTTIGTKIGTSCDTKCIATGDRVYVISPNSTPTSKTLVYDKATGTWSVYSVTPYAMASDGTSRGGFCHGDGGKRLTQFQASATTDEAAAISWSYQTGYSDVGGYFRGAQVKAAERKTLRMTDIYGSGTLTHQVLALNGRPNDVADAGGSVTLGTAPAVARGRRRRATRGTYFAHKLSGSGVASVSKLTHWITSPGSDA